jgi:hypothetical protein
MVGVGMLLQDVGEAIRELDRLVDGIRMRLIPASVHGRTSTSGFFPICLAQVSTC